MSILPLREEVQVELEELTDDELADILEFIRNKKAQRFVITPSEEDDPAIGFFSGPPDFASTSQEILRKEFGRKKFRDSSDE